MSDVIAELRKKEKEVQELRTRESRRQGQEDTLRKQLKDEFKLESVEAANTQLNTFGAEIAQTEADLASLNAELERIIQSATEPSTGATNGTVQRT